MLQCLAGTATARSHSNLMLHQGRSWSIWHPGQIIPLHSLSKVGVGMGGGLPSVARQNTWGGSQSPLSFFLIELFLIISQAIFYKILHTMHGYL